MKFGISNFEVGPKIIGGSIRSSDLSQLSEEMSVQSRSVVSFHTKRDNENFDSNPITVKLHKSGNLDNFGNFTPQVVRASQFKKASNITSG